MEKCNRCNGTGKVDISIDHMGWWFGKVECPKCKGLCILDWVEQIKGIDKSKIVRVVKKRGTLSSGPR